MPRRPHPLLATASVVLTAALALTATTAPAWAGHWSAPDPAGDATTTSYDEDPPPCGTVTETAATEGDLTRISVRHTRDAVLVRLRVTGLVNARRTRVYLDVVTPDKARVISISRHQGRTEVDYSPYPDIDEDDVNECGYYGYGSFVRQCRGTEARVRPAEDLITLSVPRRCLGTPRWVRVGAAISAGPDRDPAYDSWHPRGWDGDYLEPVVGRKVFAGRG